MNAEKIINSDLINKSELARKMWPNIKDPIVKLQNKIAGRQGQRLTERDKMLIEKISNEELE